MHTTEQGAMLRFVEGTLVLDNVSRGDFAPAPAGWAWDGRVGAWRCDASGYSRVTQLFTERGIAFKDAVPQWQPIDWPYVSLPPLRPEQDRAVHAWLTPRRGVVVMPTGTGKTEVALAIMWETAVSTLIVAPVRDLMYQWHDRIRLGLGYDAGIIGDNTYNLRPVSVTTYDSACIHMEKLGALFGLLIFDECHHLPGPLRRDAARMSAAPMRLGLTATPERSDGLHMDLADLVGPTVYTLPLAHVRGRTLADYDVVRIPVHLSADEQSHYDSLSGENRRYMHDKVKEDRDYSWNDLCSDAGKDPESRRVQKAFHAKTAIEDRAEEKLRVLEDLFRLHAGTRLIVFTGTNAMARDVSRRFLVPCLLNHCRKKERVEVLEGFRRGDYPVLVANQVLDEGVDIPAAKVAVVIGGKGSIRQAKQRLGRILRRQGDERAVLYEVVCAETREETRSRLRRKSDAYVRTSHRRV